MTEPSHKFDSGLLQAAIAVTGLMFLLAGAVIDIYSGLEQVKVADKTRIEWTKRWIDQLYNEQGKRIETLEWQVNYLRQRAEKE